MRKFVERALEKYEKLTDEQVRTLILQLSEENERAQAVLDSLTDGLLVADDEHALVLFNKAAERLLPITGAAGYDELLWECILDEEISRFVERTLLGQERILDREFTIERGGLNRILSLSLTPLVREGSIRGSILLVCDVSDRRSNEARLRRAESLASLTTLAAGMAHEIKNPLGSIGIHMQLIRKSLSGVKKADRAVIEGYIAVVDEEVERLNRIVVDFLFAVRPMNATLEDRDLNGIVRELLEFVQYELQEAGIELEADLEDDLPSLRLDEKYIKQALLNMVKNAISAMPDGGRLSVATRRKGDEVLLRVSDTGVGMSEEVMAKVFEPNFTTRDFGSGIGLTLVYKVVKEHMGDISVVSQEGRGATFSIVFPIPQREQHLLSWKGDDGEV